MEPEKNKSLPGETEKNSPQKDAGKKELSDILLKQRGEAYRIGLWKNGTTHWQGTGIVHTDRRELLGVRDIDGDGIADIAAVERQEKDLLESRCCLGYYQQALDDAEHWKLIGAFFIPKSAPCRVRLGHLTGKKNTASFVCHLPSFAKLTVWFDSASQRVEIPGSFGTGWELVGCADFKGKGEDSVLMSFDGGSRYFTVDLAGELKEFGKTPGPEWQLCAIGDFSGNGKAELLFFHGKLGLLGKWGDARFQRWEQLGQIDAADWRIIGCGNYSQSQGNDLLVRQISTGMVGYFAAGDLARWHEIGPLDKQWEIIQ